MNTPKHIAFIMDGNGRWARARGMPRLKGHEAGAETVKRVLSLAGSYGIPIVSLYAFSVENWSRPSLEVRGLMSLLGRFLEREADELFDKGIRLRVMGRREDLPAALDKALAKTEERTAGFSGRQLVLCLSYGGRTEIAAAARSLARDVASGLVDPEKIDESLFASRLYLPDLPDPDLIVRTSGERRLSNFLLWQCAYSELYSTPVAWPDFGEDDFRAALEDFASRQRRFGGLEPAAQA